jgi:threonyl-tRNA synthetase
MLKKRISLAQRSQFNYILVVGSTEEENKTVNVRTRDGEVLGEMKVEEFIDLVRNE